MGQSASPAALASNKPDPYLIRNRSIGDPKADANGHTVGRGDSGGASGSYRIPNPAYAAYAANQKVLTDAANYKPPVYNTTRAQIVSQNQLFAARNNRGGVGGAAPTTIGGNGSTTGKKTLLGQ